MKIEILAGKDSDDQTWQEMKIDDKERLSVFPLYECPEDAIIGRSLVSCADVANYMREAYEAGKRGEEFSVTTTKEGA